MAPLYGDGTICGCERRGSNKVMPRVAGAEGDHMDSGYSKQSKAQCAEGNSLGALAKGFGALLGKRRALQIVSEK